MTVATILLVDACIRGGFFIGNGIYAGVRGARKESRVHLTAMALWVIGCIMSLTNYHGLYLSWARPAGFALESLVIAFLVSLSLKIVPAMYFAGSGLLSLALVFQALASDATNNSTFERGAIGSSAVLLGLAAIAFMLSRRREGPAALAIYALTCIFYLVLLGLVIYGPNVASDYINDKDWQLAQTITTLATYALLNIFVCYDYEPARGINEKFEDVGDWFSYVFVTGQLAPTRLAIQ